MIPPPPNPARAKLRARWVDEERDYIRLIGPIDGRHLTVCDRTEPIISVEIGTLVVTASTDRASGLITYEVHEVIDITPSSWVSLDDSRVRHVRYDADDGHFRYDAGTQHFFHVIIVDGERREYRIK